MKLQLDAVTQQWQKKARLFAEDELIPHEVEAEMNSGRLRGGPQKFRQAFERLERAEGKPWGESTDAKPEKAKPSTAKSETATSADAASESHGSEADEMNPTPTSVTICLAGQVGAGKSSLLSV
ncbi:MAG: hypothetical protein IIC63_09670, partial [Proteobacteria bacterium]|nr:hypothetical protein [Pseudomonadota bacterium]